MQENHAMFRILLAEDNKDNQAAYRRMLEGAGYDIDIAENGREAVEAFMKLSFDLILMDIQMPEMDGMEAAREIRRLESGKRVPIIAFTSLASDPHRQECIDQGMDDFLNKPCNKETLLSCIEAWQEKRLKVLIVDDMKENRQLLQHYLKETAYASIGAKNGVEAISAFKKYDCISLILMDMEMPVMDGYTAARTIRSLMGKKNVPIIAMTAHEGEDEVQRCLRAGCAAYLSKPLTCQSVMRALSEHLKIPETVSQCIQVKKPGGKNRVEIDPDLAQLVPNFLNNRMADGVKINELLAAGRLEEIRIIGHSMAGSAGGYGFPEIGKIGRAIETAALASRTEEIKKAAGVLEEYLATVIVVEKKD